MACLIIISLFFVPACRKDRPQLNTPKLNNAPLGQFINFGGQTVNGGPNYNATAPNIDAEVLVGILQVTDPEEKHYLVTHPEAASTLLAYHEANGNTIENNDFLKWAVGYLTENENKVPFEQFKNQFLGKSEGQDGDFNEAYWNDPNLVVPKQNLPSWNVFANNFPTHNKPNSIYKDYAELLSAIGGDVGALYVPGGTPVNTCAIRVSYALVRSRVTIPNIGASTINGAYHPPQTLKDKDGKYYFIRAKELNAWMRRTFGTNDGDPKTPFNPNHTKISKLQAGLYGSNLPALLAGRKGIYSLVSSDKNWANGHADMLYDDATCGVKCHFADAPIDWIDIWVLN